MGVVPKWRCHHEWHGDVGRCRRCWVPGTTRQQWTSLKGEMPQSGSRSAQPSCLASQTCRRAELTCRAHPTCLVSQTCQRVKAARDRHAKATVDSVVPARSMGCGARNAPKRGHVAPTYPPCLESQTCRRASMPRWPNVPACRGCLPPACQGSGGQRCSGKPAACSAWNAAKRWRLPTMPLRPNVLACHANLLCRPSPPR